MLRPRSLRAALTALAGCLVCAAALPARAQMRPLATDRLPVHDETAVEPEDNSQQPIEIFAQYAQQWEDGDLDVLLLRGQCRIVQGGTTVTAQQMVVWRPRGRSGAERVGAYLEGEAQVTRASQREERHAAFVEFQTEAGVRYTGREPLTGTPAEEDPVYQRALEQRRTHRRNRLQPTQLIVPPGGTGPALSPVMPPVVAPVPRHVSINPRYLGVPFSFNSQTTTSQPPEQVISVSGGVNIVINNVPVVVRGVTWFTTIDLTADSAVIWTDAQIDNPGGFDIGPNTPFQVYLEGNIIVRQGLNEARASHAFYDVREERGLLMNAEVRAFVPELDTFLRLRAAQVRQLSHTNFHATQAWVSTSQTGRPGYRIEASDILIEERFDPRAPVDPYTGVPEDGSLWVTSWNNRFYLQEVPLLYAPYLSAPADQPPFPLRRAEFGYDSIFGLKIETLWDMEALLGLELPPGVDWELEADLFTDRGPAIGTNADWDIDADVFGAPTHSNGFARLYYIHDDGTDNLGLDRRNLAVPDPNRGRALIRNRTQLPFGTWLTAELGYLSDRNFLEQYYEREWDTDKDYESLVTLNHQYDNWTVSGLVRGQLNDFENETEWLPRGDLTVLSEPLFGSWLTWSSHSSVGYGRIRPAVAPTDPEDTFTPLPFFPEAEGVVAMTRHELNLPLHVGPVNIVPYVMGEAAYWEEGFTGDEVSRLYGSAGVRASIMFWKAMPEIRSAVLGLNGLAHKMVFDADYYYAQSDEPLGNIPQYNEFDENAQERFRERFLTLSFGGVLPPTFEPRFYTVRSGAGRSVTDLYHELVDDMHVLRLGWRHRWQTKVGPPDRPRIKDWMTLDLEGSWFPDEDRDNFGEPFGLLSGRYTWAVGQRTTLLADALYDLFDPGQELWSVGVMTQRGTRGSLYVGFRQVKAGPIDSRLLVGSFSYAMSPKWVSTFGTSYDVAEGIDRGQSLTVTRVGEYAFIHVGLGYDRSRDNLGVGLSVEPRFGGARTVPTQLSSLPGMR